MNLDLLVNLDLTSLFLLHTVGFKQLNTGNSALDMAFAEVFELEFCLLRAGLPEDGSLVA